MIGWAMIGHGAACSMAMVDLPIFLDASLFFLSDQLIILHRAACCSMMA
jgi:hypothetical protein